MSSCAFPKHACLSTSVHRVQPQREEAIREWRGGRLGFTMATIQRWRSVSEWPRGAEIEVGSPFRSF